MSKDLLLELFALAQEAQQLEGADKDFAAPCELMNAYYLGSASQPLYRLACRASHMPSVAWDDVLTTFATDAAAALLLSLPNAYWVWRVIEWSIRTTDIGKGDLVSLDNVRDAMNALRQNLPKNYDWDKPFDQCSDEEKLVRLASGIILVRSNWKGGSDLVSNPVFEPQQ